MQSASSPLRQVICWDSPIRSSWDVENGHPAHCVGCPVAPSAAPRDDYFLERGDIYGGGQNNLHGPPT